MRNDLKAILNESLHILNISEDVIDALESAGIQTIDELLSSERTKLRKDPKIGKKGLAEIHKALLDRGFEIR